LVSVIVRTKDRPALLAGALKSIVAQTYANLEIVVVNDGGRDVKDVVDSQAGDTPVIYIAHGKNRGRSAAANTGLNAARGLYLNFLDDDDVFYPDHVETLVRAILIKDVKVVYSGVSNAYYEGPPENPRNCVRKEVLFNRHFDPDLLLFANHIPIMSVLFHQGVFQELEGFSTELDLFEDWDFLIRASRRFSFHHVDKVTAEYRFYGVQDTEESHHRKYAYDQAQAAIFNRVLPHLTGESWIKFLKSDLPHTLGRNKESLEKRIAPLVSKLEEGQKGLGEMQLESQNLMSELTRTREDLERAANTISALKAHNEKLESLLKEIFSSRGWAWLTRYRNLKSKLDF
ncbi:MAG: glycosyltransferase, partial [Deltaproteobacteria bacterium]|nr:glycosyltransferase [Deltaproteobacteria bacterium]